MKTILFCNPKETIEMTIPNWVYSFIKPVVKYMKVRTVRIKTGTKFNLLSLDEAKNYENKNWIMDTENVTQT